MSIVAAFRWERRCRLLRRERARRALGRPFRDGVEGLENCRGECSCYLPRAAASLRSPRDVGKRAGLAAWAASRGSAQSEGNYAAAFFPLAEPKAAESNAPHSLRCRGVGRVPPRKIRRSAFKAGESMAGPQGRPLRGPGGEAIRTGRADPPRPITCF